MTASPGDGEHAAREGYYPDPSIPGYVRYWNGASWVPGTSRPAAAVPTAVRVEETGPVFLDDTSMTEALRDPGPTPWGPAGHGDPAPARLRDSAPGPQWGGTPDPGRGGAAEPEPEPRPGGGGAEPGRGPGGWQVDPVHQAGFGGPRDARVSWGDPAEPEPGRPAGISLARPAAAATAQRLPAQAAAESVGILSARPPAWPDAPGAGTSGLTSSWPEATPHTPPQRPQEPQHPQPHPQHPQHPQQPATVRRTPGPAPAPDPEHRTPAAGRAPGPEPRDASAVRAHAPERPAAERRAPEPAPAPSGSRAGAPVPPPEAPAREDSRAVFERMAERAVRPAGLGRRGVARLLDSLVHTAVAAAVAVPVVPRVTAHLEAKVDAARASGRTTTVYLLDATTAGYLGLVLGAVLLFGVLYEALPTARWGLTPGKKLLGVRVLATATLRPPGFGAALGRWLVYAFLGLPGSLWCLVDRPRRRAWHDRAAGTFVTR
ncbi:RDD family protein [Streptomyces sp. W1SF4]|uniref:RDD family protein n=1 Tax=Streptomyces sp. W1SF4 TaxID=2305220 RepID=UPI001F49FA48|nr:RDD family protein [Streptomyces sp. W1SF4]